MEESSLSFGENDLNKLTEVLFNAADNDNNGIITFQELKAQIEQHPGVMENLTLRYICRNTKLPITNAHKMFNTTLFTHTTIVDRGVFTLKSFNAQNNYIIHYHFLCCILCLIVLC